MDRQSTGGRGVWPVRLACLFLVGGALVLLLAGFEMFARWHYRDVLSTSFGRDYFFHKSQSLFAAEKNNIGYRGRDVQFRHDGVFRVIVLGDSLAWGQGVHPYTSRFPELAETYLRERYPGINLEVVNLSQPGLDLRQYLQLLPFVEMFRPDFVLYEWYVNDMEELVNVGRFHAFTLIPDRWWHNYSMDHFVTYILLYRTWNQVRARLGLQQSYVGYLQERLGDPASKASRWGQQALHELITALQAKGIEVGIVLFPMGKSDMAAYELGFLHERVLDECRRERLPCLDLRDAYAAFNGKMAELEANPLDGHPSKVAHRVAAQEIARKFGPLWKGGAERAGARKNPTGRPEKKRARIG